MLCSQLDGPMPARILRSSSSLTQLLQETQPKPSQATSNAPLATGWETITVDLSSTGTMSSDSAPAPAYTGSSSSSKPSSVFTLKHNEKGELEFSSNRKIIRISVDHSTETYNGNKDWKAITNIKADIIPTNSDVLKQIEEDVYNSQTKAALHASAPSSKSKKWWQFSKKEKSEKT